MATTAYKLVRALAGPQSGRFCRVCAESIQTKDDFGQSEGVCRSCRAV